MLIFSNDFQLLHLTTTKVPKILHYCYYFWSASHCPTWPNLPHLLVNCFVIQDQRFAIG